MIEKGRERCWKAFIDSVFDYSDSCPPGTASVSVLAGYKEPMSMLDGCKTTGKSWSPAALLPLPFLLHSCSKLPDSVSVWVLPQLCWDLLGQPGLLMPFGNTVPHCHHDPTWAPVCARPWQAQPGCKWCKRHRLFHGCSASASWPVSLAQLGNAASSSWWAASSGLAWITGEGGSCKLLGSSERHFKAPCMEQAAVWFLLPRAE